MLEEGCTRVREAEIGGSTLIEIDVGEELVVGSRVGEEAGVVVAGTDDAGGRMSVERGRLKLNRMIRIEGEHSQVDSTRYDSQSPKREVDASQDIQSQ